MEAIIARARSLKAKFGTEKCEHEEEKEDLERYYCLYPSLCPQEGLLLREDGMVAHDVNPSTCRAEATGYFEYLGIRSEMFMLVKADPTTKEQNQIFCPLMIDSEILSSLRIRTALSSYQTILSLSLVYGWVRRTCQ